MTPRLGEPYPEEAILAPQLGSPVGLFENGQLLKQSRIFQDQDLTQFERRYRYTEE
jgi:hypothetical protein